VFWLLAVATNQPIEGTPPQARSTRRHRDSHAHFTHSLQGIYAYAADLTKADPASRGRVFGKILGAIAVGNTLGPLVSGVLLKATGSYAVPIIMQVWLRLPCVAGGKSGSVRPLSSSPPPTHSNTQLGLCLLILALLGFWVQESLDPRDKPREPFNLCRTHNTFAVVYQFLLTYRSVSQSVSHARRRV